MNLASLLCIHARQKNTKPTAIANSIIAKGFSLLNARNKVRNINEYSRYHWFGQVDLKRPVRNQAIESPDKRFFLHGMKCPQNSAELATLGSRINEKRAIKMSLEP